MRVTRYLETTPHNLVQGPYTADGVAFTDHVEVVVVLNLSLSEVISFTESIQNYRVILATLADSLVLDEPEVSAFKAGTTNIHDTVVFAETLQVTWIDVEEPADTVSFVDIVSYTITRNDFTDLDTVVFSDSIAYSGIFLAAPSDSITFSDEIDVMRIRDNNPTSDSLTFSDEMEWDHYGFGVFSDVLSLLDVFVATLGLTASATDSMLFDYVLTCTGVWQGHYDETLTFSDVMSAESVPGTSVNSQLPKQLPFQLGKG